jgi:CDP-diacylglycerol--glycerol-3-phosphate 3-phosphatidyltransferase
VIVLGLVGVLGASLGIARLRPGPFVALFPGLFVVGSVLTWATVSGILLRATARELPSTGVSAPRPWWGFSLGAANTLTLTRGWLVSLLAGFALSGRVEGPLSFMPGVLYAAAALSDRYDGILARRLGQVTSLGRRLDVSMDALGLLVASLVGARWGRLPAWYLVLGFAYYLFGIGLWARRRLGLPVHPERLRPYATARFFAGVQMVVCVAALVPVLSARCMAWMASAAMVPTLGLFARDWLIVIGRRQPIGSPER